MGRGVMVRDFNIAEKEEDTSYYAGFVGLFSTQFSVLVSTIGWLSLQGSFLDF
ncbi:hypothetical protein HanHA300_Chr09g0320251 [Helianthus annuus]|nr:hypothetical protein HanHA300_Chr09g0320251 [Helianthus annuus]KAJ0542564.1 hypothetical protein HanHA89_Chr09g0341171 [Helianthus annuus]KAJ0707616.1 hypothetical protein HanLR1_Chr09g0320461 [Helianthus annuus]